ncbi:MAG TPA: helix-turn-helix transcriptional regulator [Candidatus Limnocylindria bacterium]|nr:helix-turn-helix transcriptional regulator [Candidatus Limnocylindria bacterium]
MIDWELNLFHSDPTLLERSDDDAYERATRLLQLAAEPGRLKLLHALSVGEDTPQRAALWSGLDQPYVERELAAMVFAGLVARHEDARGPVYAPRDGHLIVALHVALAHGREVLDAGDERHPRLLRRRRDQQRKVG